ncbi:hypothetical protein U0070_024665 [Myodes glareolus]|uniref:Aminopeptidase n=1 Tax=Myodes glareolus TaxID=447135 RepID=A0AAW0JWL3_MYOGA
MYFRGLIASQMEATFARTVFPCFDEPALKATFNITIIHHPGYTALSNMPQLGQSERIDVNGSRWMVTTFYTTPRMPTYLVALAICDFDHVSRTERGKEIRIWARKDAIANGNVDFAMNATGPIFSFLEDLFNISYSLPKTDIIALPHFDNRAMENWGLLTFDESSLLLEPDEELTEKRARVLAVIAHEVGHQWFGNLVTMSWWNNVWLNEGLASYFELGIINYFYPKLQRNEIFFFNFLHGVLREDHSQESRTVSTNVENFTETNEIKELFNIYTYHKGACMARMLCSFLSQNLFISALQAIDEQNIIHLPTTVKSIMDSWTYQGGFPVITLNVSTGVVKQEPFYLEKTKNPTLVSHKRVSAIVYVIRVVFPEMQLSDSDSDWLTLNFNMTGYYRVNYDELGWKKLNQQLEKDPKAIPVINRLQLLNDAFVLSDLSCGCLNDSGGYKSLAAFVKFCVTDMLGHLSPFYFAWSYILLKLDIEKWSRYGKRDLLAGQGFLSVCFFKPNRNNYIEIETALDLTKYLAEEDEILVWFEVLVNLINRDVISDVNNYAIYPLLKKYLLKRINSIWNTCSTLIRKNVAALQDNYLALLSVEKVFETACWLGLEDCLQLSKELFRKWMADPETA